MIDSGDKMKVKIFDYEHESDLEKAINNFLKEGIKLESIQYQMSHFYDNKEQIYSFSALLLYSEKE